jgi:hypothetical protein
MLVIDIEKRFFTFYDKGQNTRNLIGILPYIELGKLSVSKRHHFQLNFIKIHVGYFST